MEVTEEVCTMADLHLQKNPDYVSRQRKGLGLVRSERLWASVALLGRKYERNKFVKSVR